MKPTEGIYESRIEKARHPLPLFRQEATVSGIPDRVVNVYCLMADIIIAAKNEFRTRTFQLQYIFLEFLQPDHLEGLAFITAGTGRMINTHNGHIAEVGTDKAPFVIVFFNTHTIFHMVRFLLAQNSDSAIPLLLCRIQVMLIPQSIQRLCRILFRLQLCFLQTKHIRLLLCQPLGKTFCHGSP